MADLIFHNKTLLERVNGIVHPMVKEYVMEEVRKVLTESPDRLIVIEAALLLEDNYDLICDEIWYVYAEEEIRIKRLKEDRQYSDDKIKSIMNSQINQEEYKNRCQRILYNNLDAESVDSEEKLIVQIRQALRHE